MLLYLPGDIGSNLLVLIRLCSCGMSVAIDCARWWSVCMCACVYAHACVHLYVCAHMYVRACACVHVCVHAYSQTNALADHRQCEFWS